jgi:type I restriction enzyme S subunit
MKSLGNFQVAYKQVRLGDYFKFEKGLGYKGEFLAEESDVAMIGMDSHNDGGGYKDNSEKPYSGPYKLEHVAEVGDVIFAATEQGFGLLASPLMVPDSDKFQTFIFSHHVLKAFPVKDGFLPEYLYNIFRVDRFRAKAAYGDTGTTVRALPAEVLEEQLVPLPDLPTQQAINEMIAIIDQQISNNKLLSKSLEMLAQAMFKSWFVDFDPVHAKSRGEAPFGMDEATASLFPSSFQDSEIGDIPKGWKLEKLGDVANLLMGQSPPGHTYNENGDGLPFYQGRTDFGNRFPEVRVFCTVQNRTANAGETLVSVRAPVGDINQAIQKCVIGRGVAAILHKSQSEVYTYSLMRHLNHALSHFNGEGTVFGAINRKEFESLIVVEPQDNIIKKFEDILGHTNKEIRELYLNTVSLEKAQKELLYSLINGLIQIPQELIAS